MRKGTILIALAALAVSLFFLQQSLGLPESMTPGTRGPGYMPRLFAVLAIILCGLIIWQAWWDKRSERVTYSHPDLVFTAMAVCTAYVALVPVAGYFMATFLFLAGFILLLKAPGRWTWLVTSVLFVTFIYVVFYRFFRVPLPLGNWPVIS